MRIRECPSLLAWRDSSQRLAQEHVDRRADQGRVGAQLGEHGLDVTFAEAQMAEAGKDLGVGFCWRCCNGLSVGCAVGVTDVEVCCAAVDDELAAMAGAVMNGAEGDEV